MKLTIMVVALFLVGCGAQSPEQTTKGIVVSNGEGTAIVQEVTLFDGTKCATLVGYYKGAISCGWK